MKAVRGKMAIVLLPLIALLAAGVYFFVRSPYVPPAALDTSRQFISLAQSGRLPEAYLLTDQGARVGATPEAFEAKLRRELGIDTFPVDRPVVLLGRRSGYQSYGNRLRRWIAGRKLDPDEISFDYYVGPPFEVRLVSDAQGRWRVTSFQSHAM